MSSLRSKALVGLIGVGVGFGGIYYSNSYTPASQSNSRPKLNSKSSAKVEAKVDEQAAPENQGDLEERKESAVSANQGARDRMLEPGRGEGGYIPRQYVDSSGYLAVFKNVELWEKGASLTEIGKKFKGVAKRKIGQLDRLLAKPQITSEQAALVRLDKAVFENNDGDPVSAYDDLCLVREYLEKNPPAARDILYTVIYFQGISSLRRGENENCVMCVGESSCIVPIAPSAYHKREEGSRAAVKHFGEYLEKFPEDMEVRWLMNVAHMTLGEYPDKVDPKYLVPLDHFRNSEFDIGAFRNIAKDLGLARLNQAGGGIMEDFDNDGLLDIAVSTFDPTTAMAIFLNAGNGTFTNHTEAAKVTDQLGGLNSMQTDYNNDGFKDVFIVRGAWLSPDMAMRPTLLRNNGDKTFTDVTEEVGMDYPVNSITASWCDYDNDGWLDCYVCCEKQRNRLYHSLKNGKFEEVAIDAGVSGLASFEGKGVAWIDYDNDNWTDLFVNNISEDGPRLYRNNKDGTFADVTKEMGISDPKYGFSCWAWDFDNDGWQDIFATCYDRTVDAVAQGLMGKPHDLYKSALYRNLQGKGFENIADKVGLDGVYMTMGSNFGDFDNDGYLDMYLGTGDPNFTSLVPNRMFKNVNGERFSEITGSARTGHLQKGHGCACGDWDRDGNIDIFMELGGAVNGDKFHNAMFQNPGHDNNWVNLRLVGEKSNKAAIGTRIKIVTSGTEPKTIYRHISSGSSFGGNPLEQTIGIGKSEGIESIEITWPATGATQVFKDVPTKKSFQITELSNDLKELEYKRIPLPEITTTADTSIP